VLIVDALDELPAGLPARPGVYLCACGTIDDEHWPAVTQLKPDVVVLVPAGRAWLLEQLDDPGRRCSAPASCRHCDEAAGRAWPDHSGGPGGPSGSL
jgi:hypothetical protein